MAAEKVEVVKYYYHDSKKGQRAFKHIRDNKLLIDSIVQVTISPGNQKTGRPKTTGVSFVALGYLKNYINDASTKQINRQQFNNYMEMMFDRLKKETLQ